MTFRTVMALIASVSILACSPRREYVAVDTASHDTIRVTIQVNPARGQVVELRPTTLQTPNLRVWGVGASLLSPELASRCDIFNDRNWSCGIGKDPLPGVLLGAGIEAIWMKDGVLYEWSPTGSGRMLQFKSHFAW